MWIGIQLELELVLRLVVQVLSLAAEDREQPDGEREHDAAEDGEDQTARHLPLPFFSYGWSTSVIVR